MKLYFFTIMLAISATANADINQTQIVTDTLTSYAKNSCSQGRWPFKSSVSNIQAREISECFINTDFWEAYDIHGFGEFGTANGIATACTRALSYSCNNDFKRVAVNLHTPSRLNIISEPGSYEFEGYGAGSTSVLILPNIEGMVYISVSGHTDINFQQADNIRCQSSGHFNGCNSF
ncbi:MAG: hypothetical protein ACRBBP_09720 [Bdellovibrionales bacterium]